MIILKGNIREIRWRDGLDSSGSRQKPVAGSYGHSKKLSVSIKRWKLYDWLSDCWLVKKESTP
jgi:hypothetical protein